MRTLLLQARYADDPALAQELDSFARWSGLAPSDLTAHDLLAGPPTLERVRSFDALMIGGSGDFYVSKENLPHVGALLELLREVVAQGHPTFASCFGFQLLVTALRGEVVHDPEHTEVGTYELELTDAGEQDELLGSLPRRFRAQMGRKDRASRLPDGVLHLASSARAPFQALRIVGKPIWATQFHPELDRAANRLRFEQYLDGYAPYMSEEERERALSGFVESSPEVQRLLQRFVELVRDGRGRSAAPRTGAA